MPRIRYLQIRFDHTLKARELPCFRAAVIEKTKRESSLFHNHKENGGGFHYRYPLIQYKLHRGRASIVCLDQGTDDIHHLLQLRSIDLKVGDRPRLPFRIEDMHLNYHTLQTWEQTFDYNLMNWLALNQANYRAFIALESESERKAFLERILIGNILSMAQGFDWIVDRQVKLQIHRINRQRTLPYKGQKVLAFDLDFSCNVSLPPYIGLGKGASVGFGVVGKGMKRRSHPDQAASSIPPPLEKGSKKPGGSKPGASEEDNPLEQKGKTES